MDKVLREMLEQLGRVYPCGVPDDDYMALLGRDSLTWPHRDGLKWLHSAALSASL